VIIREMMLHDALHGGRARNLSVEDPRPELGACALKNEGNADRPGGPQVGGDVRASPRGPSRRHASGSASCPRPLTPGQPFRVT